MKQLCNCCPSFVGGLQLHPATLDTSTPQTPLDNTRHPLDPLDTLDTLDTPRHWQAWYQPRQASTGLDTSTPRQQLDTLDTGPRHLDTRAQAKAVYF
jgi:hypothetical protein